MIASDSEAVDSPVVDVELASFLVWPDVVLDSLNLLVREELHVGDGLASWTLIHGTADLPRRQCRR